MVGIEYLYVLKLLAALGCGLIAGVFFAFSTFVMKALAQQHTRPGNCHHAINQYYGD
jgi:uncharacterized membrane protein